MCVDDEKSILSSLNRLLRKYSYKILLANSGAEGLKLLEQSPVDLIISDMRMPEMTGAVFLSEVSKKWPDTIRILLTGYADLESTITAVNDGEIYRYISKPWDENHLVQTIKQALEVKYLEIEKNRLAKELSVKNKELEELNNNLEKIVDERTEKIQKTYNKIVSVFTQIVELKEGNDLAGHSRRVSDLTKKICKVLNVSKKEEVDVYLASLLHDIGKIGMDEKIVNEPYNQLSPKGKEEYQTHARRGSLLLKSLPLIEGASQIIHSHHEAYDGSGFPEGLSGNDIPLGSMILAIANDYDNLIMGTKSGNKMEWEEAIEIIKERSNIIYSSTVVAAFLKVMEELIESGETYEVSEYIVSSSNIKPGMILASDVVTKTDLLLLSKKQKITESMIEKIHNYEKKYGENLIITIYKEL